MRGSLGAFEPVFVVEVVEPGWMPCPCMFASCLSSFCLGKAGFFEVDDDDNANMSKLGG
jgi:hypothetical protein